MENLEKENSSKGIKPKKIKKIGNQKTEKEWEIKINFVPFESEKERDESYRNWVESFFKTT